MVMKVSQEHAGYRLLLLVWLVCVTFPVPELPGRPSGAGRG